MLLKKLYMILKVYNKIRDINFSDFRFCIIYRINIVTITYPYFSLGAIPIPI